MPTPTEQAAMQRSLAQRAWSALATAPSSRPKAAPVATDAPVADRPVTPRTPTQPEPVTEVPPAAAPPPVVPAVPVAAPAPVPAPTESPPITADSVAKDVKDTVLPDVPASAFDPGNAWDELKEAGSSLLSSVAGYARHPVEAHMAAADLPVEPEVPQDGQTRYQGLTPEEWLNQGLVTETPPLLAPPGTDPETGVQYTERGDRDTLLKGVAAAKDLPHELENVQRHYETYADQKLTPAAEHRQLYEADPTESPSHTLEVVDFPRRALDMAEYWVGKHLPAPTSAVGDYLQDWTGRLAANVLEAMPASPTPGEGRLTDTLSFWKLVGAGGDAAVDLVKGTEPATPSEAAERELGENLYKGLVDGTLYQKGIDNKGYELGIPGVDLYQQEDGGINVEVPFEHEVGTEVPGYRTPYPMGIHVIDVAVPPELARRLAASADTDTKRWLYGNLTTHFGREAMGLALEFFKDPLWLMGPAKAAEVAYMGEKAVALSESLARAAKTSAELMKADNVLGLKKMAHVVMGSPEEKEKAAKFFDEALEIARHDVARYGHEATQATTPKLAARATQNARVAKARLTQIQRGLGLAQQGEGAKEAGRIRWHLPFGEETHYLTKLGGERVPRVLRSLTPDWVASSHEGVKDWMAPVTREEIDRLVDLNEKNGTASLRDGLSPVQQVAWAYHHYGPGGAGNASWLLMDVLSRSFGTRWIRPLMAKTVLDGTPLSHRLQLFAGGSEWEKLRRVPEEQWVDYQMRVTKFMETAKALETKVMEDMKEAWAGARREHAYRQRVAPHELEYAKEKLAAIDHEVYIAESQGATRRISELRRSASDAMKHVRQAEEWGHKDYSVRDVWAEAWELHEAGAGRLDPRLDPIVERMHAAARKYQTLERPLDQVLQAVPAIYRWGKGDLDEAKTTIARIAELKNIRASVDGRVQESIQAIQLAANAWLQKQGGLEGLVHSLGYEKLATVLEKVAGLPPGEGYENAIRKTLLEFTGDARAVDDVLMYCALSMGETSGTEALRLLASLVEMQSTTAGPGGTLVAGLRELLSDWRKEADAIKAIARGEFTEDNALASLHHILSAEVETKLARAHALVRAEYWPAFVHWAKEDKVTTGFKTEKGSTYAVYGRSTQRTKSPHQGHDPKDVGVKEQSVRTVYVDPKFASEVGMWNTLDSSSKQIRLEGGKVMLLSKNHGGPLGRDVIIHPPKYSTTPRIGLSPLELWKQDKSGHFRGNHPGTAITEVTRVTRYGRDRPIGSSGEDWAQAKKEWDRAQTLAHVATGAAEKKTGGLSERMAGILGKSEGPFTRTNLMQKRISEALEGVQTEQEALGRLRLALDDLLDTRNHHTRRIADQLARKMAHDWKENGAKALTQGTSARIESAIASDVARQAQEVRGAGKVVKRAADIMGIRLEKELEKVKPRFELPESDSPVHMQEWEAELQKELHAITKDLDPYEALQCSFAVLRDGPTIERYSEGLDVAKIPGFLDSEVNRKAIEERYGQVVGQRYQPLPSRLEPVVLRLRGIVDSYEALYKKHGFDFLKDPYERLRDWGVDAYAPHILDEAAKTRRGDSQAVRRRMAEFGKLDSGIAGPDKRFGIHLEAEEYRKLRGTIQDINRRAKLGDVVFTLDPNLIVARYMHSNRAIAAKEFLVGMVDSGVAKRFADNAEGTPAAVLAAREGYAPLFVTKKGTDGEHEFARWMETIPELARARAIETLKESTQINPQELKEVYRATLGPTVTDAELWARVAKDMNAKAGKGYARVTGDYLKNYYEAENPIGSMYIPRQVLESMKNVFDIGDNKLFHHWSIEAFRRFQNWWKTHLTVTSVAFSTRNAVSNTLSNILDLGVFGALHPATQLRAYQLTVASEYAEQWGGGSLKKAYAVLGTKGEELTGAVRHAYSEARREVAHASFKAQGLHHLIDDGIDLGDGFIYDCDEALKILRDRGVISPSYTQYVDIAAWEKAFGEDWLTGGWKNTLTMAASHAEDLGLLTVPMMMVGHAIFPVALPKEWGKILARRVENQARLINFTAHMSRGGNIEEAVAHVLKFLFDYGDLTQTQKTWMRTAIPWFAWTHKNVALQLDMIQRSPAFYNKFRQVLVSGGPRLTESVGPDGELLGVEQFYNPEDQGDERRLAAMQDYARSEIRIPLPWIGKGVYMSGAGTPIEAMVRVMGEATQLFDAEKWAQGFARGHDRNQQFRLLGETAFIPLLGLEMLSGFSFFYNKDIQQIRNATATGEALKAVNNLPFGAGPILRNYLVDLLDYNVTPVQQYDGAFKLEQTGSPQIQYFLRKGPYGRNFNDAMALTEHYHLDQASNALGMLDDPSTQGLTFDEIPWYYRAPDAYGGFGIGQQNDQLDQLMLDRKIESGVYKEMDSKGITRERTDHVAR